MRIDSLTSQNMQAPISRPNTAASNEKSTENEVSKAAETKGTEGKNLADKGTEETKVTEESENVLEKNVTAISRDGDTLVISADKGASGKISTRIPDASLTKYSKSQLQKMFKDNKITRQQYEKAVKGK